ncbi:MAG: hypothetical protein AB7I50_01720 [Vicinamibacterales bacterium]
MDTQREHRPAELTGAGTGTGDGGDEETRLDRLAAAERVLASADAAINRVLSRDSERFLRAARQTGGQ